MKRIDTRTSVTVVSANDNDIEHALAIRVFSDVKLEWMKQYSTTIGEDRWSLTLYTMDDNGIIQNLHREVDPSQCPRLVSEYLSSVS
jgi:hypothetical protein